MSTPDDPVIHSPGSMRNGPTVPGSGAGGVVTGAGAATTSTGIGGSLGGASSVAAIQHNGGSGVTGSVPGAAAGNLLRLLKGISNYNHFIALFSTVHRVLLHCRIASRPSNIPGS